MKRSRNQLRLHRKRRVRAKVFGTAKRPRLAIFRSLKNIYVQVIDDTKGKTLAAANLKELAAKTKKLSNLEKGKELGKLIAQKCAKLKISSVILDRGGYKYHGKVKAVAEGAREGGLKF